MRIGPPVLHRHGVGMTVAVLAISVTRPVVIAAAVAARDVRIDGGRCPGAIGDHDAGTGIVRALIGDVHGRRHDRGLGGNGCIGYRAAAATTRAPSRAPTDNGGW